MENYNRLVNMLKAIDADKSLPDRENEQYILQYEESEYIQQIEFCANDVLITNEGQGNFPMMDKLYHEHGFFVLPGERDSFGWVTGLIRTKKGLIVFG